MRWELNWLKRHNLLNKKNHNSLTKRRKPLAYILGNQPFLGSKIVLKRPLLIPRPETEFWVSNLINELGEVDRKALTILDLCCGTGCIGIAFAKEFMDSVVYAIDNSQLAVKISRFNAKLNNILGSYSVLHGDVFKNDWVEELRGRIDLIVSNPPYVPDGSKLPLSVKIWEDPKAIFGGINGIDFHKRIIDDIAPAVLRPSSLTNNVYLEIDPRNAAHLGKLYGNVLFEADQFQRLRLLKLKI